VAAVDQSMALGRAGESIHLQVGLVLALQGPFADPAQKPASHRGFYDQFLPITLVMKVGPLVADGQDVLTLRQAPFDPLFEFGLIDQLFHL